MPSGRPSVRQHCSSRVRGSRRAGASGTGAAVLVPLFEEFGEARVVLTVRSDQLRSHRARWPFPEGDSTPMRASSTPPCGRPAKRRASPRPGDRDRAVEPVAHRHQRCGDDAGRRLPARRPDVEANPGEVERVFDVALERTGGSQGTFTRSCGPAAGLGRERCPWPVPTVVLRRWPARQSGVRRPRTWSVCCPGVGRAAPAGFSPGDRGADQGLGGTRRPVPQGVSWGQSVSRLSGLAARSEVWSTATRVRRTSTWLRSRSVSSNRLEGLRLR